MYALAKKLIVVALPGLLAGCIYVNPWPDPGRNYNYGSSAGPAYGSAPTYGGAFSYNPNGYSSGYAYGPGYDLNFSYNGNGGGGSYGGGADGCCYGGNGGDWYRQHPWAGGTD